MTKRERRPIGRLFLCGKGGFAWLFVFSMPPRLPLILLNILIYRLSEFAYIFGNLPNSTARPTKKEPTHHMALAGGTWNPEKKLWRVPFGVIRGDTELEGRIVKD
ncbi:hypothetical protein [Geomobilimonas luticola]|uniref:Uncharacterized protein n=1 Tax=Geomobilimonas luticola TaxID=1114878 RepID=A0ABS5SB90_9BACT|nr:hypothetical protein [Geomobilimonas luticola]MBT0651902.1 hypothetical protein [Geomobilimonas luticola]